MQHIAKTQRRHENKNEKENETFPFQMTSEQAKHI